MVRTFAPDLLTVLLYHRVAEHVRDDFDTFTPNVSATLEDFTAQMEYISQNYNVISCGELAERIQNKEPLPPHTAIITFDDGYYDNYQVAFPVLKRLGLPATIFATTDFIGSLKPSYWDLVAYCFHHTKKTNVELPLAGPCSWNDAYSREAVMLRWIAMLKEVSEAEKRAAISSIEILLDVALPDDAFRNLHLSWDQVREMSGNGIEFGAHTVTHPILTNIPLSQVSDELTLSMKKIEAETGRPVVSFAYPNGQKTDFSDDVTRVVGEAGIKVAFTCLAGPTCYSSVMQNPLTIRRCVVDRWDTFPRFIARLYGLTRLLNR
jgi:peptidoglycan/xylan/chitin deacetylase (PgdA/CDA1 family)